MRRRGLFLLLLLLLVGCLSGAAASWLLVPHVPTRAVLTAVALLAAFGLVPLLARARAGRDADTDDVDPFHAAVGGDRRRRRRRRDRLPALEIAMADLREQLSAHEQTLSRQAQALRRVEMTDDRLAAIDQRLDAVEQGVQAQVAALAQIRRHQRDRLQRLHETVALHRTNLSALADAIDSTPSAGIAAATTTTGAATDTTLAARSEHGSAPAG